MVQLFWGFLIQPAAGFLGFFLDTVCFRAARAAGRFFSFLERQGNLLHHSVFFLLYSRKSPHSKFLILAKRIDAAPWMLDQILGDIILRGQPLKIRVERGLLLLLENYSCYFLQIALQKKSK